MVNFNRISILFILLTVSCLDRNQSQYIWVDSELVIFSIDGDSVIVSKNAGMQFIDELKNRDIEHSKDLWFVLDTEISCWQTTSISTDSLFNMEDFKTEDLFLPEEEPGVLFDQQECGFYVSVGNSSENMKRYLKFLDEEKQAKSRIDSIKAYENNILSYWPLDYYVIFSANMDSVLEISEQL